MQTFLKPPDWWQRTISRFPHSCSRPALITLLLLLVGTVSASLGVSFTKATTPTATVSVNAGVSTGTTLQTQLSTNNVWAGMLDEAPSAQAEFKALHMPLVRIHMGDDGTTPAALPEVQYGNWDFSSLDALVNNVTKAGQQALMNVKFAPDWMWTCYPNSVGMTYNNPTQGTGTVKDLTFQTFAQYMARLVSYYNKGSMTTESGQVITNPAGTANRQTYWELWNEPDLNIETPCAPPDGYGITPAQYVTMWNALTSAMLAVDPTLKFVGPGTAGSQFGSSTATGNEYIDDLMSGATVKPVAISFHDYGYWDNSVTDQTIFDGDNSDPATQCCGGIVDITHGVKAIHAQYPTMPIWLTEVNVNAAWGNDPYQRPWTAFGAAWWGALFQQVVPLGVALINQFDVIDSPQFGLIAEQTGAVRLPYWEMMLLEQGFPQGSTFFSSSSSLAGVLSLAVRKPDGTISILVVNRQLNSSTATGGPGLPATVAVNIQGVTPAALTLQQIDATTNVATGPAVQTLSASSTPTLTLGGYGFAVLTVTPSGQGSATPTPTPTTTTAATPTAISSPTPTPTPIPSPTATPTSPSTSSLSSGTCAYLFCDGFESGSLPGTFSSPTVSSGNSLTLDSSLVHSGHESLKAVTVMGSGGNAYITKALTTGQSTLDTRAYLYLSNPVNWAGVQLLTYYAQGNAVAQVTYNVDPTSPNLQVYMDANNHWYSCSRTPSLNVWHSLELQVSLATTATGSFSLQLDGSTICAASGIRTSAMSAESINQVNLGSDTSDSSGGLTIHLDDVAIGTSHIGQ